MEEIKNIKQAIKASIKIKELRGLKESLSKVKYGLVKLKLDHFKPFDLLLLEKEIDERIGSLSTYIYYRLLPVVNKEGNAIFGDYEEFDGLVSPINTYKSVSYLSSKDIENGYIILTEIDEDSNSIRNKKLSLLTGEFVEISQQEVSELS